METVVSSRQRAYQTLILWNVVCAAAINHLQAMRETFMSQSPPS